MTATLTARGFGATRGARTLFDGLDLVVAPGDVWGLTGPNGAGKSTLLHALAGDPVAEMTGQLTLSPPDATVGLLRQEVERDDDEVVRDFLHRVTGVADALARMNALAEQMADSDSGADAYGDALERWLALGGGDLDERIPVTAARLGLDDTVPDLSMSALSGGQAARVNLGAVLLSQYDILLLDEPTNDLDLAGLAVLEEFMQAERRPMVVVSHDREFLARCVTGIVELDSAQQQIAVFDGGYEAYLAERALARQRARDAYEEYAGRVDQLKDRVQTQKSWLDKGVRNTMRKTGGKDAERDKHIRNRAGQRSEKQAAKISQSERAMERLEVVAEPRKEWELQMEIATAPRSGSVVAVLAEAVVRRGDFVLGPVTLQIDAGDRILISGSNGSGNTTWHLCPRWTPRRRHATAPCERLASKTKAICYVRGIRMKGAHCGDRRGARVGAANAGSRRRTGARADLVHHPRLPREDGERAGRGRDEAHRRVWPDLAEVFGRVRDGAWAPALG
ncbi:ATP-binding cassette domain-containing protein [Dietzia sp. B19]|uniref:ATP-binding cassette domain-containing protein n=1 Tax=Dietzia sp. B19 TaxID=1630632 RepID=UPI001F512C53|nr:ATP-binding cassette domain-containing protein [Dietzia sp. B19]